MKRSGPAKSSGRAGNTQRHKVTSTTIDSRIPPGTKEINVGPLLETTRPGNDPDAPLTLSKIIGVVGATLLATLPALATWGLTLGLIFGGCCSNVGNNRMLFLLTALFTWPYHFSAAHPPFFLKPRAIPLTRWLPNIILFFTVNVLNNYAFGFNISVPVHIILRSGGSVFTMLTGFIWGKRYTPVQILSVALLTIGIIIAAMADAQSKGKSTSGPSEVDPSFIAGLLILLLAQILSAIMGLYTQITYSKYGSQWHENLFYSHFLSLPLFLPLLPSLRSQWRSFISSPSAQLSPASLLPFASLPKQEYPYQHLHTSNNLLQSLPSLFVPRDILSLAANAQTQYLCICGVNLLSARTTALGVTIVLNMRKLASLLLSIWLFGNKLPPGVLLGAAVVFGSAGIWAWEGQRIGKRGKARKQQ
ncbi:MAG: hypothetical protein Q9222_005339 [Ikaeria aurantiellina]